MFTHTIVPCEIQAIVSYPKEIVACIESFDLTFKEGVAAFNVKDGTEDTLITLEALKAHQNQSYTLSRKSNNLDMFALKTYSDNPHLFHKSYLRSNRIVSFMPKDGIERNFMLSFPHAISRDSIQDLFIGKTFLLSNGSLDTVRELVKTIFDNEKELAFKHTIGNIQFDAYILDQEYETVPGVIYFGNTELWFNLSCPVKF
jgi:hypothetical protein